VLGLCGSTCASVLWQGFFLCCAAGVLCGLLYKVPAMLALSWVAALSSFILTLVSGGRVLESFIVAFLLATACQFGYLLGVAGVALSAQSRHFMRTRGRTEPRRRAEPRGEEP
jgi:hypothetical protein